MKNEKNTHDVTSADLRLHQKRGRQALMLEIAGDYTAAAQAWQNTANKAPLPQWRIFARERGRYVIVRTVKQPVTARKVTRLSAHQGDDGINVKLFK